MIGHTQQGVCLSGGDTLRADVSGNGAENAEEGAAAAPMMGDTQLSSEEDRTSPDVGLLQECEGSGCEEIPPAAAGPSSGAVPAALRLPVGGVTGLSLESPTALSVERWRSSSSHEGSQLAFVDAPVVRGHDLFGVEFVGTDGG